MGILSLNTFLRENCRNIDNIVHFSQLKYKKICVDVYNYIYRFLAKDKLIEDLENSVKYFKNTRLMLYLCLMGNREEKNTTQKYERIKEKKLKKYINN